MAELQRGVVKWFNDAKGFGFIEHTSGRDVFVHYSVIEWDGFKTLKDGEEVHYELSEGDKGLHAAKVVRLVPAEESEQSADGAAETTSIQEIEIEKTETSDGSEESMPHSIEETEIATEAAEK